MSEWKLPWNAGCRCDRVRMRVTAPPLLTMACHCTGCQRMTASAYSLSFVLPAAGLEIVSGEPVLGGTHGASRQHHCPHCKSWLFTNPEGMDDIVNLRATMVDGASWYTPFVEVMTSEGFAWARTGAVHSFPTAPAMDVFGPLVAEYAASGARPS